MLKSLVRVQNFKMDMVEKSTQLKADVLGRISKLRRNEEGASLVEYSILIGLIAAAVIVAIVFVGGWVTGAWNKLTTNLGPVPT